MKIGDFFHLNLHYLRVWKRDRKGYIYLRNLLEDIRIEKRINKTIVFNTIRNFKNIINREFFLGALLSLNGANVFILLDDGILKHWDTFTAYSKEIPNFFQDKKFNIELNPYKNKYYKYYLETHLNKNLTKLAIKSYSNPNFKVIFYSQILKNINYENWKELKKFAYSSTIRFFNTSILNFNNKFIKYYYNLSLKNALLRRIVGEYIYNELKPDLFITSHGIYSTWAPAFKFLFDKGINTLVYSGIHGHSLNSKEMYFSNTRTYFLSQSKYWQEFKKRDVTDEMKSRVRNYFKYRQNLKASDTKILYKGKLNSFKINKDDGYKYHIALFPNVIWDGNIRDRHIIFDDYLDWINSTINYLKNRKDVKLYIKSHPSEITVLKNSPKITDIVSNEISSKNINNIILIPPERKINTYEFLKSGIDLGIVYDGFLAVEMPYLGIPTIMCVKGGMFYVENGNITPKDQNEYFDYLKDVNKTIHSFHNNYKERLDNIVKYLYWYLFVNAVKVPTLSNKSYLGTDLMQLKQKDFVLNKTFLKLIQDA